MLRSGITSYQCFSYILTFLMLPVTVCAFWPVFTPYLSIAFVVFFVLIYILVIYLTIKDSCIPELTRKVKNDGFQRKNYKPEPGRHVIENSKCNICDLKVQKETKHCKRCNYCVGKFDHHCVWLNNCIGEENYRLFMLLISSVSLLSLCTFLISSYILISWFSQSKNGLIPMNFETDSNLLRILWILTSAACVFVYLIAFLTTTHLLVFHIRLFKLGMTTYKFIVSKRRAKVGHMGQISTVSRTNTRTYNSQA